METLEFATQNGREGFSLVGTGEALARLSNGEAVRGTVRSLGRAGRRDCYALEEGEGDTVVSLMKRVSVTPVAGVTVVEAGDTDPGWGLPALVVASTAGAVAKCSGYKGRSTWFEALAAGATRWERASPAVLLAAGLVSPAPETVREVPAPAPPMGALAAALAAAGLA